MGLSLVCLDQLDIALNGQSNEKSYLLEILFEFRFNTHKVKMGTCRPLILQMVSDLKEKRKKMWKKKTLQQLLCRWCGGVIL